MLEILLVRLPVVEPICRKVVLYTALSSCHLRQCLPYTTYASGLFHKSLNNRPIPSICMVLDLVAISLVVVVLDTPPSDSCVFLSCRGVLLQYKSWFHHHLHKMLSTD